MRVDRDDRSGTQDRVESSVFIAYHRGDNDA